jgi:hypothetical protein
MDLYTLKVDKFRIEETRALHTDTLHLSYSAFVNGDVVAQETIDLHHNLHLGEGFNNGDYNPDDHIYRDAQKGGLKDVVINDPTSTVAFNYQLINAGVVLPLPQLRGRLEQAAHQIVSNASGLAGAASAGFGVGFEMVSFFYDWLTIGECDGPVAVDQISAPRYMLDYWADQSPSKSITRNNKEYPGPPSPTLCNDANSKYVVSWSLEHHRRWLPVGAATPHGPLDGLTAAAHNGAVHAVGLDVEGPTSYRTFTGATWDRQVIMSGPLVLVPLLSAVSFNDRLYVFAIEADGSVKTLAFTVDGGSWTPFSSGPLGLQTDSPFATVEFRNRLYVIARDSATQRLRLTSTDDMIEWNPWSDVPEPAGIPHDPALAAVSLNDVLHVFGVYRPQGPGTSDRQLLHNSTTNLTTWTGWQSVERGAVLPQSVHGPLDVAAGIFQNRIYLASRWEFSNALPALALNFSADGDNWSGWRTPESDRTFHAMATAALAPVNHHLYIFGNGEIVNDSTVSPVSLSVY